MVLDYLTSSASDSFRDRLTRRQVSSCSLTCRYWSDNCRQILFRDLTLTSLDDARTLITFVKTPGSNIKSWLRFLTLIQTEPSVPWTHLIYMHLLHVLPRSLVLTHQLKSGPSTGPLRIRSLHYAIPRQIPGLFLRCSELHITDLHFRSFLDLIELIGKMKGLVILRCQNLTWEEPPRAAAPELRRRRRFLVEHILLENCSKHWPFLWLTLTARPPGGLVDNLSVPFIDLIDVRSATAFVRCMSAVGQDHSRRPCKRRILLRTFQS